MCFADKHRISHYWLKKLRASSELETLLGGWVSLGGLGVG